VAKKNSPNYWVKPADGGGWDVEREGGKRASGHFDTQKEANDRARDLAQKSGGERITQGKDGKIKSKDSYGNDPKSRKDTEH
jgi:hypothetical protein